MPIGTTASTRCELAVAATSAMGGWCQSRPFRDERVQTFQDLDRSGVHHAPKAAEGHGLTRGAVLHDGEDPVVTAVAVAQMLDDIAAAQVLGRAESCHVDLAIAPGDLTILTF